MASPKAYRLYAFVAAGYLSELQRGLQTAHAVSRMSRKYKTNTPQVKAYSDWADHDETIIICTAFNHKGVVNCYEELLRVGEPMGLPVSLFREDEQSMNGMATACAIVVPQEYYDAREVPLEDRIDTSFLHGLTIDEPRYSYTTSGGGVTVTYPVSHPEGQLIKHIKGYRLA